MYRLILILVFVSSTTIITAQEFFPKSFIEPTAINEKQVGELYFNIRNTNFVRNNEFFNNIVEGYTLIGYFVDPTISYTPSKNTKIEAGVHLLKYSGVDQFT